ncbi:aminotransferase class I/II-fold pyridoxal phosphate-dependent enzyme [Candidatus Poribacteria bacterium]|nr:aminotransferase class I/II-fold pyridoxal phosphate-dependent enzyme [Candidatus Poribacteria bacterium]
MEKPAIAGGEPIRNKPLSFGVPLIEQEEINGVVEVLKSGWISTGPKTQELEKKFREYVGSKYAVAVNSCTAGMHVSLVAAGIGEGDEVITTPMTFTATSNSVIHCGATPVFADINRDTMNIDPAEIESKITSRTKAIMPVHYSGQACEMDEILDIARKNDLIVIEDAAHALGAEYKGKKVGSIGHAAAFSFHVHKNITTAEGGMVSTDNDEWAKKIRVMRLHGMTKDAWGRASESKVHYDVVFPGFKYNMTDIQAAMGLAQLSKLESYIATRQKYARMYTEAFKQLPQLKLLKRIDNIRHGENMFVIRLELEKLKVDRDEFVKCLKAENITPSIHYRAVHLNSYYRENFGYKPGDYPNAEYVADRVVTMPFSPKLTEDDVRDVISAVTRIVNYYSR